MAINPSPTSDRVRFGDFDVDLRSHEILRFGRRVRLQEKSFLLLQELLKRPGQVVTREELTAALWPKDHFVDAEHGLNTAVRRLREALGDSADEARFVATLPKVGYRFIGALDTGATTGAAPPPSGTPASAAAAATARPRRGFLLAAAGLLVAAAALVAAIAARSRWAESAPGGPAAASPTSQAVDELLARARYLRNHKRLADSRRFVEQALELDPKNAEALAGLALGFLADQEYDRARETARRAIEIDPDAWEAHRTLGNLALWAGDFTGAERHYRRAVEANPDDSKSRNRLARHLLDCGRLVEAKEQMIASRRLDPNDPDVQNIWIQYALLTGDYEGAVRQGKIWIEVWGHQLPTDSVAGVRYMLGLAYVGARRTEDALAQFREIDPRDDAAAALVLGYGGRHAEARAMLAAREAAAAGVPFDAASNEAMARAYIVIGDFDRAFERLEREVGAHVYPSFLHLPLLHAIRGDARWPAFTERLQDEFFRGKQGPVDPHETFMFKTRPALPTPAS